MPAMPVDTDMIDASAPVVTPGTALVATSNSELVSPMHAGTCHAPCQLCPGWTPKIASKIASIVHVSLTQVTSQAS